MRPDIVALINRLNAAAPGTLLSSHVNDLAALREAAAILQAVFDPENQPSQFGTVLRPEENRINAIIDDAARHANHGNDVEDFERYEEYERHAARNAINSLLNDGAK